MNVLARGFDAARSLFRLTFPMFGGAAGAHEEEADPARRWAARSLLVGTGLGLLWMLNRWEALGLRGWVNDPRYGQFWLPLFALCLYATLWLAWWLYRVLSLGIEPLSSEFPDIDRAWERITRTLAEADIPLDATPLFLAIGASPATDTDFLRSTGLRMKVKPSSLDADEPVRVAANRDGIWVTCPGASALADLIPNLVDTGQTSNSGTLSSLVSPSFGETVAPGAAPGIYATIGLQEFDPQKLQEMLRGNPGSALRPSKEPERSRARLRHLCRLMARDRLGFCPVNGILVMLPATAAAPKTDIEEIAQACRTDLTVVHETFRIRCPTLFVIGALDTIDGFAELVTRLPSGQVENRRGQRYPLVPDLDPEQIPESVRGAVRWIAETYLPSIVHNTFQVETPGGEGVDDVLAANARLFRFMTSVQGRRDRLGELVQACLPALDGEPMMFSGCYLAGAASSSDRQAFAAGVLQRMVEDQDRVTWTSDLLGEDASYHRNARLAKRVLGALIVGALLISAYFTFKIAFPDGPQGDPEVGDG